MTPEERSLLEDLFARLRRNESAARDPEAEAMITEQIQQQPHAAYFLAQSVLVQEAALREAEKKINALSGGKAGSATSFLGDPAARGPWGERVSSSEPPPRQPMRFGSGGQNRPQGEAFGYQQQAGGPQSQPAQAYAAPGGGGSFLRNAAQTAVGVAGGVLAAEAISSMFSHGGGLGGYAPAGYGGDETIIENQTINEYGEQPRDEQDVADDQPLEDGDDLQDASYDDQGFDDDGGADDGFADDGGYDDI